MLPNFLIVGAEKAGTTTLASILAQHPDVFMCEPKEPRYFSHPSRGRGLAWYASLFESAEGKKAVGEASTAYTWHPHIADVPQRIHETLGDIRYIYMVRDPVERLISHYRHAVYYRWIPEGLSLDEAVERCPALFDCGRYAHQVEQYRAVSAWSRWKIIALEDLLRNPEKVQRELCSFLSIGDHLTPLPHENAGDDLFALPEPLRGLRNLQALIPGRIGNMVRRKLKQLWGRRIEAPELDPAERDSWRDRYRAEVERLSARAGRDFAEFWWGEGHTEG
ncbi:sulfotransferase family protein [Kiritimatiella glycovorans]|uniref:Sulfotransferase domain protein n=1 Tax=Kiritimatiella glycovorans TaxID=1307763 RepID=A0A0G3EGD8_9BACT|nr:sulfotransferase [Kiritimatiella glycovorans]AKJ65531.1 Sulfotransferase domain protein [Kiritimatiella glycovorans]